MARSLIKTKVFRVDPRNPDEKHIRFAAAALKRGGLVAFPTETVYGLAASFVDPKAVARVYEVKKRPKDKPLTVQVAEPKMIEVLGCEITAEAKALMDNFWPGPLTVIVKSKDGGKTGFRIPDNRIALNLIKEAGVPIVAPSANLSGNRPPLDSKAVLEELGGQIEVVLDGGRARIGVESTVIDMTVEPPAIIRKGAIGEARIMDVLSDKGAR